MAKKIDESNILLEVIVEGIQDIKGKDIIALDLRNIASAICKYFIICTGTSNTHLNSIERSIRKKVGTGIGEKPWHVEGSGSAEWILMDYADIVVHIFQEQTRLFYSIEEFWGDAKCMNYTDEVKKDKKLND